MPEILPEHVPMPRCVIGWDGTRYRAFAVDAAGHVQVDVVASGLPAGAATAANQVTMITALELIDDLRGALASVATDSLQIRGEDQVFTYKGQLRNRKYNLTAGAGTNTLSTAATPGSDLWVVTTICAYNVNNICTSISLDSFHDAILYPIKGKASVPAYEGVCWNGVLCLTGTQNILATFRGCIAGDDLWLAYHGYKMTLET